LDAAPRSGVNKTGTFYKGLVRHQTDKNSFDTEEEPVAEADSGPYFAARAEQELKRAERYLSFVSLVTFEVVPVGYGWDEELKKKVAEVAGRSVRETDLVGVSDAYRVAVLLVETPRRGAEQASERIAGQLLDYCLKEKGKSKLVINIHAFPEDAQGKEDFLSALEKLR
jgi:GGDEF domain-containing protein